MEIFYLRKSEFLKSVNKESLGKFSDDRKYSSEEKYLEHLCGLFLIKFIAKHVYKINNFEIEKINNKPFFKNEDLFFSASHSRNIVLVAFNNKNIGADVEYISERKNFKAIMERLGEKTENPTLEDFYKFWTQYEAKIKLNKDIKSSFTTKLGNNYMLSCVSDDVLLSCFSMKRLVCDGDNIDLGKEFDSPENCKLITSVE